MDTPVELATFGGGCFWCTEAVFSKLRGVSQVTSGYMGGHLANPSYNDVCSGRSGHVEVIQLEFAPSIISYAKLLEVFFSSHDPTTLDRQGNDVGPQYRSAVFCHTPQQAVQAVAFITQLEQGGQFRSPIVTEIRDADHFYPAEDYHQRYFEQHPLQPYCAIVIRPKVEKAARLFADWQG